MRVGHYQLGRYHAIIKKTYEDGSVDYETDFSSRSDLAESIFAVRRCIGKVVGLATSNPRKLVDMAVIYGKEDIMREIGNGKEED